MLTNAQKFARRWSPTRRCEEHGVRMWAERTYFMYPDTYGWNVHPIYGIFESTVTERPNMKKKFRIIITEIDGDKEETIHEAKVAVESADALATHIRRIASNVKELDLFEQP